jgi:aminopeptidase N
VVSQDLIDAFETTLRRYNFNAFPFDRAFRTWETQKGYPLLNVRYDSASQSFVLTQNRFFERKEYGTGDQSSWYIPLNFYTANSGNFEDTTPSHYFQNGVQSFSIPATGFSTEQWVVFNKQQRGYFRVNYDDNIWRALSLTLSGENYQKIHVMNRAQLIDDSFALVRAGYLEDYQTPYDILKYLVNENDYFPWYSANRYLAPLINVFGFKDPTLIVRI